MSSSLQEKIFHILQERGYSLATAESCTGGLLAGTITEVPGVSEVFRGGFVTYTNEEKNRQLGVAKEVLDSVGAVSAETARQMAEGAARKMEADCALSVTGNAGPGASEGKPVGLVFIGCFLRGVTQVREFHFDGDRQQIRKECVKAALKMLRRGLREEKNGRCILMCAGEFDLESIEHNERDFVIAVDGGLVYLDRLGIRPDFILGDFDSLPEDHRETLKEFEKMSSEKILHLPAEKDDTDTMAAVKMGLAAGYNQFLIYGGLGRRIDHTMANIQTLTYLKHHGAHGWLIDRHNKITVLENEKLDLPRVRATFSLFALEHEVRDVTLTGMKYPLNHGILRGDFPLGVSNEIYPDRSAVVTVGDGPAMAVISEKTDDGK